MSPLPLLIALELGASSLRISVDRSYLPGESGDNQPTAHLVARGTREVEVTLYHLQQPLRSFLGLPGTPFEPSGFGGLRRELWLDYRQVWRSLDPGAQALAQQLLPRAARVLAAGRPIDGARPAGRLVRAWRLATTDSGWNYQDVPLGSLEAGLYEIDARAGAERATTLLSVSRLALLAEGSAVGTSIVATDAAEGHPLAGVDLFALPSDPAGFPLALGKTGSSGLWTSPRALSGPIVGRWEGQFARVVMPDAPSRSEAGRGEAGAIFLDRGAYAPGDVLHAWCLLRDREGGGWKIPEQEDARVELVDPVGTVLLQQEAEISALGIVSTEVPLPRGLAAGWYGVAVSWGAQTRAATFRMNGEAAPELEARWERPAWSAPRDPFEAAVAVVDRLGRPAAGVAVHWSAATRALSNGDDSGPSEPLADGAGVTGADGKVNVRIGAGTEGRVILRALVEDAAARTAVAEAAVPRVPAPVLLDVEPDRRVLRPGHGGQLSVDAQTLDGQPFRGPVEITVASAHSSGAGESVRTPVLSREVGLDARGHASVAVPTVPAGYLDVQANLPGLAEPLARTTLFITEAGGDIPTTPDRLELVLDRREYARGDDLRALVLTPFESGSVLIGLEPATGPADQLLAVRGYSGLAHLKIPAVAGGLRLVAAALSGGTLYRAAAAVPLADRSSPLALKLFPERPSHGGDRAALTVIATDADGHGVPASVAVWSSPEPLVAPPLARLFSLDPPSSVWLVGSAGAGGSSRGARGEPAPRRLQPYGPTGPESDEVRTPAAQLLELTADDSGRATASLRIAPGARRLSVVARAVGGPGLFAERAAALPLTETPHVTIDAPPWVRAGDRFSVVVRLDEVPDAGCTLELAALDARLSKDVCNPGGERVADVTSSGEGDVELSAAAPRVAGRREVHVVQPASHAAPSSARQLAADISGTLSEATNGEWPDVDCAAARAAGALPPTERPDTAAVVARLVSRQNLAGGFGPPEGELRRDLAALSGLVSLQTAGAFVSTDALARLRQRVVNLAQGLTDPEERSRVQRIATAPGEGRRTRLPEAEPPDVDDATPASIADWLSAHRTSVVGARGLLARLLALLPAADPLDLAEISTALAALPPETPVPPQAPGLAVARRFLAVVRRPWTQELLDTEEDPPEAELRPIEEAIPLDTEVEVALSAEVPGAPRLACLRDFPPAGLSPIGRSDHLPRGLLLCGQTSHGRLDVSYLARAVRSGRFLAPGPVASPTGGPGPATWVEVTP